MGYHNGSIFIGKPQRLAPCTQHPQHEDLPGHRIKDLLHGRPKIRAADDRAEGRRFGPGHGLWDPHCLGELQRLGNCWWFFSKRKWKDSSRNWWFFLEVSMSRFDRKNDGFHAATFGTGLKSFQKSCHVHRRIPHEGVKRLRPGTVSGKCD